MAQIYQMISYAGFILTAVFLVVSLVLWLKFGIRKIIGDLSGRAAKKSIDRMRKSNEESWKKSYRPMPVAMQRGTITNEMDGEITVRDVESAAESRKDSETGTAPMTDAGSAASGRETMSMQEPPVMPGEQTEILNGETERLTKTAPVVAFAMVQDIVLIHTEERI